jgi:hypothetical protein
MANDLSTEMFGGKILEVATKGDLSPELQRAIIAEEDEAEGGRKKQIGQRFGKKLSRLWGLSPKMMDQVFIRIFPQVYFQPKTAK